MEKWGLFSIIKWNKCAPVDLDNDTESDKIFRLILRESIKTASSRPNFPVVEFNKSLLGTSNIIILTKRVSI